MRDQRFGIEIEMTGITRATAARVIAGHFNTTATHIGGSYDTYSVRAPDGRQWNLVRDQSIDRQNSRGRTERHEYSVEMVTPICKYDDITTIQEIVRRIIVPEEKEVETSLGIRRLNNEIAQMFEGKLIDGEAVREKMITYVSLRYAELDNSVIKAQRLKDIFTATIPLQTFSLELLEKTVDEIKMYADGTLGIVLENGQEIRREVEEADGNRETA